MKKVLIFLAIIFCINANATDYYVTDTGSSSNTGLSENQAWEVEYAFTQISAGDRLFIKAGNYFGKNCVLANSGTNNSNRIEIIGYTSSTADINPTNGSTYNYGDPINSTILPFFRENRNANKNGDGTAIDLGTRQFVTLKNILIQYYSRGVDAQGDNVTIENITSLEPGNHNSADANDHFAAFYDGWGLVLQGNNGITKNCYVENAGAQGITISNSANHTLDYNEIHTDNTGVNACDYYLLLGENTTNATITNTTINRHHSNAHFGHGICFKTPTNCTGNTVDGFTITNTNLELQFPGVTNNTVKNGRIYDNLGENADMGGINLANGSHDNHFENIYSKGRGIYFRDWNDGLAGDVNLSSYNNTFYKLAIEDAVWAVNFNHFSINNPTTSAANNNKFYNCTFKNFSFMYQVSRPSNNTEFVNCIFNSGNQFKNARGFATHNINDNYTNSTFHGNGFSSPSGTAMQNVNPVYQSGVDELGLIPTASELLTGGIPTPFNSANTRIGYYDSSSPPINPPVPHLVLNTLKSFPTAMGDGKNATGGRGGSVYHVTNLLNSGAGSLRQGLQMSTGARTIVFDISGEINITSKLQISNGHGDITIAGETAPDGGITIKGASWWVRDGNLIIRNLRLRTGYAWSPPGGLPPSSPNYEPDDAMRFIAFSGEHINNVILDHVTISWGRDGVIDFSTATTTPANASISNITIQNSIISENVDKGYAVLLGGKVGGTINNMTFYNNYFAHFSDRVIAMDTDQGNVAFVNNIVYGVKRAAWIKNGTSCDFIGNNYITNPNTSRINQTIRKETGSGTLADTSIFFSDNVEDGGAIDYNSRLTPHIVTSQIRDLGIVPTPSSSLVSEILPTVGASMYRDAIDVRVTNDAINLTGTLPNNSNPSPYPTINSMSRPAGFDANNNGIADSFESLHGLPTNQNATKVNWTIEGQSITNNAGYTNLEMYLFHLAGDLNNGTGVIPTTTNQSSTTQSSTLKQLLFLRN